MPYLRVTIKFNQQNLGTAVNTFFMEYNAGASNSAILSECTDWMEDVYGPLRPHMDSGCVFGSGEVAHVAPDGSTLSILGSITPNISGTAAGDSLPLVDAASAFARTDVPRVRGSKRFPGISENAAGEGLFFNSIMAALASAVLGWVSQRGSILTWLWNPGVISSKTGTFERFSGTAVITNIPGTQVTRKPLRGA